MIWSITRRLIIIFGAFLLAIGLLIPDVIISAFGILFILIGPRFISKSHEKKPVSIVSSQPLQYPQPHCPGCGNKLRLIPEVNSWFCDNCRMYPQLITSSGAYLTTDESWRAVWYIWKILMLIFLILFVIGFFWALSIIYSY